MHLMAQVLQSKAYFADFQILAAPGVACVAGLVVLNWEDL
jgi:hypothetical protein